VPERTLSREAREPLAELTSRARGGPTTARPLSPGPRDSVHVIAEIKRRSPSKGALAGIPDPVALAHSYEAGGSQCDQRLTEERSFGGSLGDLSAVAEAVSIPVLRKDFIGSEYQIVEARAHGADMVLLIMAGLDGRCCCGTPRTHPLSGVWRRWSRPTPRRKSCALWHSVLDYRC
jgi:indole-3-glycerol phosphate synthase